MLLLIRLDSVVRMHIFYWSQTWRGTSLWKAVSQDSLLFPEELRVPLTHFWTRYVNSFSSRRSWKRRHRTLSFRSPSITNTTEPSISRLSSKKEKDRKGILCPRLGAEWIERISWLPNSLRSRLRTVYRRYGYTRNSSSKSFPPANRSHQWFCSEYIFPY